MRKSHSLHPIHFFLLLLTLSSVSAQAKKMSIPAACDNFDVAFGDLTARTQSVVVGEFHQMHQEAMSCMTAMHALLSEASFNEQTVVYLEGLDHSFQLHSNEKPLSDLCGPDTFCRGWEPDGVSSKLRQSQAKLVTVLTHRLLFLFFSENTQLFLQDHKTIEAGLQKWLLSKLNIGLPDYIKSSHDLPALVKSAISEINTKKEKMLSVSKPFDPKVFFQGIFDTYKSRLPKSILGSSFSDLAFNVDFDLPDRKKLHTRRNDLLERLVTECGVQQVNRNCLFTMGNGHADNMVERFRKKHMSPQDGRFLILKQKEKGVDKKTQTSSSDHRMRR